jgi:hypothetical protein
MIPGKRLKKTKRKKFEPHRVAGGPVEGEGGHNGLSRQPGEERMKPSMIIPLFAALLVSACYSLEIGTDSELLQSSETDESDNDCAIDSGASSESDDTENPCDDSDTINDTDERPPYDWTDCMATFQAWQDGKAFPGDHCYFGNMGCGSDPQGLWCLDGILQMYCHCDSDPDSPDALFDSDETCPIADSTCRLGFPVNGDAGLR